MMAWKGRVSESGIYSMVKSAMLCRFFSGMFGKNLDFSMPWDSGLGQQRNAWVFRILNVGYGIKRCVWLGVGSGTPGQRIITIMIRI